MGLGPARNAEQRAHLAGGGMTERLSALFCIGCGRIDVPEPCIGPCDERVVDLVLAKDHDEAQAHVGKAVQQASMLRKIASPAGLEAAKAQCTNAR